MITTMKVALLSIAALLVVTLFIYISLSRSEYSQSSVLIQKETSEVIGKNPVDIEPSWLLFENSEYGYRLYHPKEWRVMDSSCTYEGRESVAVRIYSPTTTLLVATSDPLVFSILLCRYNGTFKFNCNTSKSLAHTFYHPNKPGESRQEPDFVIVSEEVVKNSQEYKTALKIFETMTSIE